MSELTSAKIGVAFACNTANVVADIVSGGTMTSSPTPIPNASRAACIVAVPFTKEIPYLISNISVNFSTNRRIKVAPLELLNSVESTSVTYFSSLEPILFNVLISIIKLQTQ